MMRIAHYGMSLVHYWARHKNKLALWATGSPPHFSARVSYVFSEADNNTGKQVFVVPWMQIKQTRELKPLAARNKNKQFERK